MANSPGTLGRRTFLRSATAAASLTAVGLTAAVPSSATARRVGPAPETVSLPDGIRPEGITSGPGSRYYVGSLANGRIVTGDLRKGTSEVLLMGSEGRQLRGLYWDARSNLVWAAGNVGDVAHVWAVDARSGRVKRDIVVPGAAFLNDLVVTQRAVWVTDSRVDRLTVIPLGAHGRPTDRAPQFLPLSGEWPMGDGVAINANGIRQLPDGSAILNNSRVGGLWQVDAETGVATEIPVSGGPGIVGGDGLELDGRRLYNVRGSGFAEVSVLRLLREDGAWQARWLYALTADGLDVPSTATLVGDTLWAVNARFGVPSPETADYWITPLPVR